MVQLQEFKDYGTPKRKPWLLIITLVVVIGAGWWWLLGDKPEHHTDKTASTNTVSNTENKVKDTGIKGKKVPSHKTILSSASYNNSDISPILDNADKAYKRGDLLAARKFYYQALQKAKDANLKRKIEDNLGGINIKLVMAPLPMPEDKVIYIVKSGDSLGKIARRNGTTVELIQKSNNLSNPNIIRKGDRLLILKGKFLIKVSKSKNELILYFKNRFFKRYPVATGKFDKTPEGTFKIVEKTKNPVWWSPDGKEVPFGDPKNILGTRWMSIRATGKTPDARGYGIHGTWDDASIGKSASAGCIRMHNKDVEELFTMVPRGTEVLISE